LRLTPHSYSPSVLGKIVRSGAREPSFEEAAKALDDLAELTISSRQAGRIAHEVGQRLQAQRDQHVEQFQARELEPRVETRPALAVVEVDGGRLRIRQEGDGPGAHDASWREDKIAMLATAALTVSDADPEPELPACFRDRAYVERLVREISGVSSMSPSAPPDERPADAPPTATAPPDERPADAPPTAAAPPDERPADAPPTAAAPPDERPADAPPTATTSPKPSRPRPELLVRTYVASTCSSDAFGPMVAAEAERRNFRNAGHRAFVGDGAAWIWKLQRQYFPRFVPIVDFLHALGYVFAAAKAAQPEAEGPWALFQTWAEACWKGQVGAVIEALQAECDGLGPLSAAEVAALADDDRRKILIGALGYLEGNRERMDYPRYRREGLPWTSSHVESTVKLFNRRVKGTEKSWGETGAEAILQLRAASLSEDGRLEEHLKSQPSSPFRTYKAREDRQAA
jgi:hypothetical protein